MVKRAYKRFTLIELLVTIGVMVMLLGLMAPAFNRMIVGNQVDTMASNLKLGLEQARSQAASSRRYVALILPGNPGSWSSDDEAAGCCFGGYRLAYVKKIGASWNFDGWVTSSSWGNKPRGAFLYEVSDSARDSQVDATVSNFFVSDLPDGDNKLLTVASVLPGDVTPNCPAVIFDKYGAAENDELHLTIAEGVREGDDLRVASRDNYLVLKLNKFTGKVEYVQND